MAELTVIWWREIPAQVVVKEGRRSARVALDDRFQTAIDAAAMKAGLVGTDAYLEQWRQVTRPCGDDLEGEAAAEAARLDAAYDRETLVRLTRGGGVAGHGDAAP